MNVMTQPTGRPGGLSLDTFLLGHRISPQYRLCTSDRGRIILALSNLNARAWRRTRDLRLSKQSALQLHSVLVLWQIWYV